MKKIYVLTFIIVSFCSISLAQKKTFLRVYTLSGNKFNKGYLAGTTDSSVLIRRDSIVTEIPVYDIGYLKTRRSMGHNILLFSIIGAVPSGIIGLASGEPKETTDGNITLPSVLHDVTTLTPGEGLVTGVLLGSVAGTITGIVTTALTKRTIIRINGNLREWKQQKKLVDQLPFR